VHLIRHGQGYHNVYGEADEKAYKSGKYMDAHLTELGWQQVLPTLSGSLGCVVTAYRCRKDPSQRTSVHKRGVIRFFRRSISRPAWTPAVCCSQVVWTPNGSKSVWQGPVCLVQTHDVQQDCDARGTRCPLCRRLPPRPLKRHTQPIRRRSCGCETV